MNKKYIANVNQTQISMRIKRFVYYYCGLFIMFIIRSVRSARNSLKEYSLTGLTSFMHDFTFLRHTLHSMNSIVRKHCRGINAIDAINAGEKR